MGFKIVAFMILLAAQAEAPQPPADDVLEGIAKRGRELAAYDSAAWHGSDAFMAINPDLTKVTQHIAYRDQGGWKVAFGRRDPEDASFVVAYEAKQRDGQFTAEVLAPAVNDTDFLLCASFAIDLARQEFGGINRPYNYAVLPTPDDQWWVYLFPASTEEGVWPLGGDVRYTIAGNGKTIVATRRLHKTVLETGAPDSEGTSVANVHVHVLECIPEDTDVLAVLLRNPAVREYVICDPFSFAVDEDGSVRFIGHSQELWGSRKKVNSRLKER